jgi:nifR3 family TIM-barrel protein
MAEGARVVSERGPDLIDVNCGCPVRKIVNRNAGAALLREPSRLSAIVRAMARAVPVPITVKMRSGWEEGDDAVAVARAAEDAGAAAIAVHGRTREARFGGRADWEVIGRVKAAVGVPVIGNGDVRDGRAAREMMAQTGCDLVMVGRWAVGNPWIFRDIHGTFGGKEPALPGAGERVATAVRHLRLSVAAKGPVRGVREMRRTVWAYIKGLPGASALRPALMTEGDVEAVVGLLQSLAAEGKGGETEGAA